MKAWTIPTILRELRRVILEIDGYDIMKPSGTYDVTKMIEDLTKYHMGKEMEIPGQTAIVIEDEGM